MKNLLVILMLLLTREALSQYDPSKINKKAVQLYTKALQQAQDELFKDAIQTLKDAVKLDDNYVDAYLSIAGMYGELKNYQSSIDYYELAKSKDSVYFKEYNLPYSINLAGKGEFEKALAAVNDFLTVLDLNE